MLAFHASAKYLVFHGAIVLLIGLLCGAPYGRAINRGYPYKTITAWKFAHGALPLSAMLMFSVAGFLSYLSVSDAYKWFIALVCIVSSYAFCYSLPAAAIVGHRGLTLGDTLPVKLVFFANLLGAGTSLIGAVALMYAGYMSL
jgi:hypothetical protein